MKGRRTLLCDHDPQGASGFYLRIKPSRKLQNKAFFKDVKKFVASENVFKTADKIVVPLIPTTLSVRTFEQLNACFKERAYQRKKLLPFFSMVQNSKKLHKETMISLRKEYKSLLKNYISFSSEIEKMGVHRAPVLT